MSQNFAVCVSQLYCCHESVVDKERLLTSELKPLYPSRECYREGCAAIKSLCLRYRSGYAFHDGNF